MVALPSLADDGTIALAQIMVHANAVLSELVANGLIAAEERGRMTLASCPRRQRDLLAPFAGHGQFKGMTVERSMTLLGANTAGSSTSSTKTQGHWPGSAPDERGCSQMGGRSHDLLLPLDLPQAH